ncbi:MAG: radical SAM family heme chaperone HemW [Candidatus Marinimicrobia bacterium]|nr:radical SAM family heme chaperone HemW [Candidatus Neomarinimicrobiota bacterium]MBL7023573.1 radical SAM family heme chaperone HemW [Candidatus Neomarinimicrobiota bacterium]MBL7109773.1 radical SAM family heme chaperone HemW [Candidatus Neomarinimicrobiota bacterium]
MKLEVDTSKHTAGIYIHIPFCKSKCVYCDFYSVPNRTNEISSYITSLLNEIELFSRLNKTSWNFDTIYFGGGTPSLLKPIDIQMILTKLDTCFNLSKIKEISIEVNPGEISYNKLKDYYNLGINRLSIGCQSFDEKVLKFLRRIHSPLDSITTYHLAREVGFSNISLDLIYNIPNQNIDDWQEDLETAVGIAPEHISAYALTIEENTPLHTMIYKQKCVSKPPEDIGTEMFLLTHNYLEANKYSGYEVSNFAKQNQECKHNLHYWNLDTYLGFGPSAHSYNGKKRWWNANSLVEYRKMLQTNQLPILASEILSKSDKYNEAIMNGMRLKNGIQLDVLRNLSNHNFDELLKSSQNKWGNFLLIENNYLKLTQAGRLFTDEISSELFVDK